MIQLALAVVAPPDESFDLSRVRIERHQRHLHFRHRLAASLLLQLAPPFRVFPREQHIDVLHAGVDRGLRCALE